jgi:hypothetical protein
VERERVVARGGCGTERGTRVCAAVAVQRGIRGRSAGSCNDTSAGTICGSATSFDEDSANMIASTQKASGLRLFAGKFAESKHAKADVLLSLESRAKALRPQTLEALALALRARLLFLVPASAEVVALSQAPALSLPESVRPLIRSAEKLGTWCGRRWRGPRRSGSAAWCRDGSVT